MIVSAGTNFRYDVTAVIDTGATTSCLYVSKDAFDKICRANSFLFVPVGLPCNKILQAVRVAGIHYFDIDIINGNECVSWRIDRLLITSSVNDDPISIIGMDVLSEFIVTMNEGIFSIKHPETPVDNTTLNNTISADASSRFMVSRT